MNSVIKMAWIASLAAAPIFGQDQETSGCCEIPPTPVCKPEKCCVVQAPQVPQTCLYNAPAEINVGCQGEIDLFGSLSFLYWQPRQDNMDVGVTDTNVAPLLGSPGPIPEPSIRGDTIEMDFSYHPGFKVGLGMNLETDDWDGYAEYTRVHGTSALFSNGPLTGSNSTGPLPAIFNSFGHPFLVTSFQGGQLFNTVSARYKNNLDFLDIEMGRAYYVGKSLIFRPAWGARAAWILQHIRLQYKNLQTSLTNDASLQIASYPSVFDVFQNSHSWAIGPRTGLTIDWMLDWGIRFYGRCYGDLLYTKYKVRDKSIILPFVSTEFGVKGVPVSITTHDRPMGLRSHLDFEMGLGWGSYFDHNNWHIDLSASYGWQVFLGQNMFREYKDGMIANNILPNGNLYVQGLTITARIDF